MNTYGALMEVMTDEQQSTTRRKPVAVPLCPPQNPHVLVWV